MKKKHVVEFPAGLSDVTLPYFIDGLKGEKTRYGMEFNNELGSGQINNIKLSSNLEVSLQKALFKGPVKFIQSPNQNKSYFAVSFCNSAEIGHKTQDLEKTFGAKSIEGVFFSNIKEIQEFSFPGNQNIHYVSFRFYGDFAATLPHSPYGDDELYKLINQQDNFVIYEHLRLEMTELMNDLEKLNPKDSIDLLSIKGKAYELLGCFFKTFYERKLSSQGPRLPKEDIEVAFKVKNEILSDLSQSPTINELAEKYGVSQSKLKQIFKQVFGNTIYQLYQGVRMEKAKKLLSTREYKVSQVGYELGYSNLSHFSEAFKKQFGILPTQYIESL
jgi:AraC-like DNA-binding protein